MVKDAPSKMGKFFFNLRLKTVKPIRSIDIDLNELAPESKYFSIPSADIGNRSDRVKITPISPLTLNKSK